MLLVVLSNVVPNSPAFECFQLVAVELTTTVGANNAEPSKFSLEFATGSKDRFVAISVLEDAICCKLPGMPIPLVLGCVLTLTGAISVSTGF